uniref:MFS domain-containing protein n=1 Tax=Trichuris muris TaxID=70415 RepID=A0A5S6PZH6_TRIMR
MDVGMGQPNAYQQGDPAPGERSKGADTVAFDEYQYPPPLQRSSTLLEKSVGLIGALHSSITKGELLVSKLFYFFFYAAFGSLFPLISIYFKQLGMNATQAGILVGIRPFVEFASAPFWGGLADRFRKGKLVLLFALICWIVSTLAMDFVQPTAPFCLVGNGSSQFLIPAMGDDDYDSSKGLRALDIGKMRADYDTESRYIFSYLPDWYMKVKVPGMAPEVLSENAVNNYDAEKLGMLVSPPHSKKVYRKSAVEEVFLLLLVIITIGEFFSAPAITLADACTLNMLGDQPELYGRQRLYGSLGWGLAMFIVGIALDYSLVFPSHPCGLNVQEKNYTLCFAAFSILMSCAFLMATQFRFQDYGDGSAKKVAQRIMDSQIGHLDPEIADQARTEAPEARELSHGPKWFAVIRTFARPHYAAFLFVTWWMGLGVGLVFCFLFWHLQDIGGSPSLYGLASVINHVSEIGAYFFSFRLINKIGHTKVLYVGLLANVARFLYISWLRDPWWVLPFEFIQGLTHAAVWAAATSYMSLAAPPQYKSSAQGLLQGLHHGLGRGCGALIGGIVITHTGTRMVFRSYGFACLIILVLFYLINRFLFPEQVRFHPNDLSDQPATLAPHGIPMNVPFPEKSDKLLDANSSGFYGHELREIADYVGPPKVITLGHWPVAQRFPVDRQSMVLRPILEILPVELDRQIVH